MQPHKQTSSLDIVNIFTTKLSSKSYRIAIFHNLPGGGSVRVMNEIIRRLKINNTVEIFSITEKKNSTWKSRILKFRENEMYVHPWRGFILRNLWILFVLPGIHKQLAQEINGKKFDLAIINPDYFTKSPYLLRFLTVKHVYFLNEPPREFYEPLYIHASNLRNKVANFLRIHLKFVDLINVKFADQIIANSKYTQSLISEIYHQHSQVIYPGVDTKKFHPSRRKKSNYFLSIGGLSKIKGHDFVIEALKPILGRYKLVIVGDGKKSDLNRLKQIAGSKEKYIKIIRNHVSDKELVKLYQNALTTCIGSYREPFGLTSIESQACGTPVVAVNEGGVRETIIGGKTGYVVNRNSTQFLEAVISTVKSTKMRHNSRINMVKNWTWPKTLKYI